MPRNHKHYAPTKNTERRLKNILLTTILRNRKQPLEEQHDPYKADKKSSKKNNERTERIKWTEKASVILSFLALVVAWFLYKETFEQRKLTEKSTNAAVTAITHTLFQDSINYDRDTTNDRIQRLADIKRDSTDSSNNILQRQKDFTIIELTKQSTEAQKNSVEQAKKQFKIESDPILELVDFKMTLNSGLVLINCVCMNYGKYPIRVDTVRIFNKSTNIHAAPGFDSIVKGNDFFQFENRIITREHPLQLANSMFLTQPIDGTEAYYLAASEHRYFLVGEVIYTNLSTKDKKKFLFRVWITLKFGFSYMDEKTIDL